jgi:nucleotide-binding universal stress UspA family protein
MRQEGGGGVMEPRYRRVLALVDLDRRSLDIARQAWNLARRDGARFGLAHVVDWGEGSDDYNPLTPSEVERRLRDVVSRKLRDIAANLGAEGASASVAFAGPTPALTRLLVGWQPDLLVAGEGAGWIDPGQARIGVPGWECDCLAVPTLSVLTGLGRSAVGWLQGMARLGTAT